MATADTSANAARRRVLEWEAEIEANIASIRATRRGEGVSLTRTQARALAGEWYNWFLQDKKDRPPTTELWDHYRDVVTDTLRDFARNPEDDPEEAWEYDEDARAAVRPMIADWGETAQFLASRRITLDHPSQPLFLDFVYEDFAAALTQLIKQAKGDYSPDLRPAQFPKFSDARDAGLTPWQLFERWIATKQPSNSTVDRWRGVFLSLQEQFSGRRAASITEHEARDWARGLVGTERSPRTVADVWVNAARTVFAWAVDERLIANNPFTQVKITVPRRAQTRESKALTPEEQRIILSAALAIDGTKSTFAGACRWVPWLCAYTGARGGEIAQLRKEDVISEGGIHAIKITPEAGTVKTKAPRGVPLHEHLIAQGFLQFVKGHKRGPLFYNADDGRRPSRAVVDDPTNPKKARAVKTRERLASWVRDLGVTDKELQPNHAWRHTFKQIAERCGISERVSDQITGHAPTNVSRGYGRATLADMAEALKRFPRYSGGEVLDV
ncbi:MAG: tyrosine-type recombinase/integrase [Xanthobacteraceae bacterium]